MAHEGGHVITDPATGAHWGVTEVSARTIPGSSSHGYLAFVTPAGVRRVRDYPDSWRALPDAELARLGRAARTDD